MRAAGLSTPAMFRITPDLPAHVVGFEIDGTVVKRDVEALFREVERAVGRGHVHVVGEIAGVGGLTLDALGVNLGRSLRLLAQVGRIDRYAVVTDVGWIARLAQAQGAFVPGLEVRVWPAAERAAAVAWASEPLAGAASGTR